MSIEEDIRKALEKFTFNKNLPEFIDMAKHLEERLKKGESILVKVDKRGLVGLTDHTVDFIYLELHKIEGRPEGAASLDCLGDIAYRNDIFRGYKFTQKSQRKR
jgi:hypothetical protein